MNIIDRNMLARAAAERFHETYFREMGEIAVWKIGQTRGDIHRELLALGPDPSPEAVNVAIGNESWTRITCNSCSKECDRAINVDVTAGEYPTHICAECVAGITENEVDKSV